MKKKHLLFDWWLNSGGGLPSIFDTAENTSASNKQVWGFIGDSFIMGQPAGGGTDTANAPYFPSQYFNTSTLTLTALNPDLPTANAGSMCPKFCTDYKRATGYDAIIVNTAVGGSDFFPNGDNNNYYTTGDNYADFQGKQNSAKGATGVTKLRGIIMHLGINDARSAISNANIQLGVTSLFTRLLADFPGVPIYVINIGLNESKVATQKILDVRAMIEEQATLNPDWVKIVMRLEDYTASPYWYMSDEVDVHPSMFGLDLMAAVCVKNMVANAWAANTPVTYSYSAGAEALFSTIGVVTSEEKKRISDWYERNAANGNWAILDDFWIPVIADDTAKRKSWKSARTLTGGAIANNCIATDGNVASRIMTGYVPNVNGVAYTQNSALVAAFLLEDVLKDTAAVHALFGLTGTTTTRQIRCTYNNATTQGNYSINNTGVSTVTGYNLKGNLMHVVRRSGSASLSYQRNAGTNSDTTASNGVPAGNELCFGAWNNNGSFISGFAAKFGAMMVGGNPADAIALYKSTRELIIDLLVLQDTIEL